MGFGWGDDEFELASRQEIESKNGGSRYRNQFRNGPLRWSFSPKSVSSPSFVCSLSLISLSPEKIRFSFVSSPLCRLAPTLAGEGCGRCPDSSFILAGNNCKWSHLDAHPSAFKFRVAAFRQLRPGCRRPRHWPKVNARAMLLSTHTTLFHLLRVRSLP